MVFTRFLLGHLRALFLLCTPKASKSQRLGRQNLREETQETGFYENSVHAFQGMFNPASPPPKWARSLLIGKYFSFRNLHGLENNFFPNFSIPPSKSCWNLEVILCMAKYFCSVIIFDVIWVLTRELYYPRTPKNGPFLWVASLLILKELVMRNSLPIVHSPLWLSIAASFVSDFCKTPGCQRIRPTTLLKIWLLRNFYPTYFSLLRDLLLSLAAPPRHCYRLNSLAGFWDR